MKLTRLKRIANITHSDENIRKYKRQINLVVKINKQAKIEFYRNLDPKKLVSEKAFWQMFKPLLSTKCSNSTRKITLIDGELHSKDEEVSECFNTYFVNTTNTLKIESTPFITIYGSKEHPLHAAILRYSRHPNTIRIKQRVNDTNKFAFQASEYSEVWDEINHINIRKKTSRHIPSHVLKITSNLSFNKVTSIANSMVQSCIFPDLLKLADASPIYKDGTSTSKSN